MPRYDLECGACRNVSIVFVYDGSSVDVRLVDCEFCGVEARMRVIAFDRESNPQLYRLQEQIADLATLIEALELDPDPDDTDHREFNLKH